jgi:hypothetical protein
MTVIAHHAGEELLLTTVLGTGMLSGTLLVLRARMAEFARRRRRARP